MLVCGLPYRIVWVRCTLCHHFIWTKGGLSTEGAWNSQHRSSTEGLLKIAVIAASSKNKHDQSVAHHGPASHKGMVNSGVGGMTSCASHPRMCLETTKTETAAVALSWVQLPS